MSKARHIALQFMEQADRDLYLDLQNLSDPYAALTEEVAAHEWQFETEPGCSLTAADRVMAKGLAQHLVYEWAVQQIPASTIAGLEALPDCLTASIVLMPSLRLTPMPVSHVVADWHKLHN